MTQKEIDRLKEIYWRISEEDWIDHSYADAVAELLSIIREHEPTVGPIGTPIIEVSK